MALFKGNENFVSRKHVRLLYGFFRNLLDIM